MTTAYPAALDAFTNPTGGQSQAASRTHSQQHGDLNDAVEAIQAHIGAAGYVIDETGQWGETFTPGDWPVADPLVHAAGERFVRSYRNSRYSANSIYDIIFTDINHYDTLQGVTQIAAGSTIEHATGIGGYVRNDDGTTNGVALYGCAIGTVNDAAVWGLNTLLQDSDERAIGTRTGMYLVNELDFNVMNPGTEVIGLSLGGNSLAQPTSANAFVVNPLGTGIEWTTAFNSQDGAAGNGMSLGALATSGTDIASQKLLMSYFDSGSTKRTVRVQMVGNYMEFGGVTADLAGFKFNGADIWVETGQGYRVGGNVVMSSRDTGWAAMTGTANKAAVYDVATVTLAQLAGRVAALQSALTTHGSIGA